MGAGGQAEWDEKGRGTGGTLTSKEGVKVLDQQMSCSQWFDSNWDESSKAEDQNQEVGSCTVLTHSVLIQG